MDLEYEQSLRDAVWSGLRDAEEVSVKTARERAETELGLEAGFFKTNSVWKGKSKDIIQDAFENPPSSPEKPVTKAKNGTKRKSNDAPPASNKRTKKAAVKTVLDSDASSELSDSEAEAPNDEDDASDFGDSEEEQKPKTVAKKARGKNASKSQAKPAVKRKTTAKKAKDESNSGSEAEANSKAAPKATKKKVPAGKKSQDVVDSDSEDEGTKAPVTKMATDESELSDAPNSKDDDPPKAEPKPPTEEDDESDMSVLIDEPPKKKRASNGTSKAKATKVSKPSTKKKGPDLTPNEEEIKRLQGWLVKCGVRKMWHNELKGCDSEKEKIKHLKKMLEDIGMTGRYSNEKAKDVFERRELAKELEETQKYAAQYGKIKDAKDSGSESGEGDVDPKTAAAPVPRRPKGFVDFGDSGDDSG